MSILNYIIFFAYFVLVLVMGYLLGSHNKTGTEYFLASRSMRWFPIGLSMMVTSFSASNFKAFPTEVATNGLYVMISIPVFLLSGLVVNRFFVPKFHAMRAVSLYSVLEEKFDVRVRLLAGVIFMFWRLIWMAATLVAAAKILHVMTGLHWTWLLSIIGFVALVYTVYGGIRAVIWTDVVQFFVILCGVLAGMIVLIKAMPGGIGELFSEVYAKGGFKPVAPVDPEFFSFNPMIRITLWSGLLGTLVTFMGRFGADQMMVQRYFTARTVKGAKAGVWCNVIASMFVLTLLSLFGVFLRSTPEAGTVSAGALLASVVAAMPDGVSGLVCAGILAASMSSMDSGINACSASYMSDIRPRLPRHLLSEGSARYFSSAVFGILAIFFGYAVAQTGDFFEMLNKIVNGLGSPLLGLILLALFFKRANATGSFIGGLTGLIFSLYSGLFVKNLSLHYYSALNLLVTLAVGLVASLIVERLVQTGKTPNQN